MHAKRVTSIKNILILQNTHCEIKQWENHHYERSFQFWWVFIPHRQILQGIVTRAQEIAKDTGPDQPSRGGVWIQGGGRSPILQIAPPLGRHQWRYPDSSEFLLISFDQKVVLPWMPVSTRVGQSFYVVVFQGLIV